MTPENPVPPASQIQTKQIYKICKNSWNKTSPKSNNCAASLTAVRHFSATKCVSLHIMIQKKLPFTYSKFSNQHPTNKAKDPRFAVALGKEHIHCRGILIINFQASNYSSLQFGKWEGGQGVCYHKRTKCHTFIRTWMTVEPLKQSSAVKYVAE